MNNTNMSYCMCQNTKEALGQIANTISEHGDFEDFLNSRSEAEQKALLTLLGIAKQLVEEAEDAGHDCL